MRHGWMVVVVEASLALSCSRPGKPPAPVVARPAPQQPPSTGAYAGPAIVNLAAYLPAQCYAETRDASGKTHDPCFVCHQDSRPPNFVSDGDVQSILSLPGYATRNHWENALHPQPPAGMNESEILARIRTSNYLDSSGRILVAPVGSLVPDSYFHPDAKGFDRDPSGKLTGWRAFVYTPTPGMFWPTNGSFGDDFIRLPPAFRRTASGKESQAIYEVNLAIVEAYLRRTDVPVAPTDERALGSDLDGDGKLRIATRVAYLWPAKEGRPFHFVGQAGADPAIAAPAAGLYPAGTEFLHSLRYLDVEGSTVQPSARMKELRYMRKGRYYNYSQLDLAAMAEAREKRRSPDRLKLVLGDAERGVTTNTGWVMQGFIEDAAGKLRPQTLEETVACVGCHGGIGAGDDSTFGFSRKVAWGPQQLSGLPEPRRADGRGEYATYLEAVGGGDDFRANEEILTRFFGPDGALKPEARKALAKNIASVLVPGPARALALDRAYMGLVLSQRFDRGRDVVLGTAHVQAELEQDGSTGIEPPLPPPWRRPAVAPTASR